MKRLLVVLGLVLILLGVSYMYKDKLYLLYDQYLVKSNEKIEPPEKNEYYRNYDFNYVKNTDDFEPNSYQDLLNIYYSVLNAGVSDYSFYCPRDYEKCLSDVEALANDQNSLSNINNYVHPYNSFKHFETVYDDTGKVTLNITKTYKESYINIINNSVDEIIKQVTNDSMSENDKIKAVHDYIINNSKYDSNRSDNGIIEYESDNAYGALIEGYSLCGGYTDAMELFLEKFGIKSFKISSEKHVWNAVNINNSWVNLDLTWDDPVANTGENVLQYKYFLIDTNTLISLDDNQHDFDTNIYTELN